MSSEYKDFSSDRLEAAKLLYEDYDKANSATVSRATYVLTAYLTYAGLILTATGWILPKLVSIPCVTFCAAFAALCALGVGAWTVISSYTLNTAEAIDDPNELSSWLLKLNESDGDIRARMAKGLCKAAASVDNVNKKRSAMVNRALKLLACSFILYFVSVATALYHVKAIGETKMECENKHALQNMSGSGNGNGSGNGGGSNGGGAVDSRDLISPTTTKGGDGSGTKK